jgi:hypothetical protein
MTNATRAADERPESGWTLADPPRDACCNFHRDRKATSSYAGTPLCPECAERMVPDA